MIAPQGPHKHTAQAMRQDSAEITPEQIEDARKLVAKYTPLPDLRRPQTTPFKAFITASNALMRAIAFICLAALLLGWITS
ncbi:MAG: hypothetical protein Q7V20_23000 [Aquabacterium sp.]|uniref:hypothetical protein n=1 Tax=Aquabacterium sp. TaxID=1872578 RepID=UPI002721C4D2|nr:hypothetical protein [Aquabacterium sp.]MDO9006322.1 hypothetical protein [Aquabacterium sp.]